MDFISPLRIIFAGTPEFAVPSLNALLQNNYEVVAVFTQPDRPAGRGRHLTASPVKQRALLNNIPVFQPLTLRDPEIQTVLHDLNPDIMIVAAYGLLLPASVLTIPRLGCINVHASLLPRWRGAAPIQQAILKGDRETGVTIMQMDEGLDTGAMWSRRSLSITPADTTATLLLRLAHLGAETLIDVLPLIAAGHQQPVPQDSALATHAAKIKKEDALINWHEDAESIVRLIHAFNPWPVASSHIIGNEQNVRIWSAIWREEVSDLPIGTVLAIDGECIWVKAGKGAVGLKTIQLPGGHVVTVGEALRGRKLVLIPKESRWASA